MCEQMFFQEKYTFLFDNCTDCNLRYCIVSLKIFTDKDSLLSFMWKKRPCHK